MAISAANLEVAFEGLEEAWRGTSCCEESSADAGWQDVRALDSYGTKYLRIIRVLDDNDGDDHKTTTDSCTSFEEEAEVEDEDDGEALTHLSAAKVSGMRICYDIVHSPSYQVPVLYLSFPSRSLPPPDEVYERLVPAAQRQQVKAIGIMGALSMAEHPVTGLPAYFVHPCHTQEAMATVTGGKTVAPDRYLLLWLGIIGSSVSLSMPVEIFQKWKAGGGA